MSAKINSPKKTDHKKLKCDFDCVTKTSDNCPKKTKLRSRFMIKFTIRHTTSLASFNSVFSVITSYHHIYFKTKRNKNYGTRRERNQIIFTCRLYFSLKSFLIKYEPDSLLTKRLSLLS